MRPRNLIEHRQHLRVAVTEEVPKKPHELDVGQHGLAHQLVIGKLAFVEEQDCGLTETVHPFPTIPVFRNASNCLQVCETWKRLGIALHLADLGGQAIDTSSAAGKMFLTMLAAFAEMERNLTSERIKAVLQKKRERGEFTGGTVPFGWRLLPGGLLEMHDHEQETIRVARDLRAEGLSLRKIGARLHELGRQPKQSSRWHPRCIQSLLRSQVVA